MKPTMFFLMNSIELERGGLTRASLKQASFFAEMGYQTYMVTFNFNPKYPLIREKLVKMNKVHEDVKILNFFEDIEGKEQHQLPIEPIKKTSLSQLTEGLPYDKRTGFNAYRVYDNGLYKKYIALNGDETLDFVDHFNENRYRTKKEVYDPWGNLKKVAYMDYSLNKPRQIIYYNDKKRAFMTQWNNPKNDKVQRIIFFDGNGSITSTYINDEISHKVNWLNDVINKLVDEKCVIVSDTRSTDNVLLNLDHKKAAKVWRLHSTHLNSPYTPDAEIAKRLEQQFKNIDNFDVSVFLTEEQRQDVTDRIGGEHNFHVVPHYHELSEKHKSLIPLKPLINKNKKNLNLGVVVSRLSTLKRIDHIIKAFEKVVKEIPDARLQIWGKGDQEDLLHQLIKDLNLESNVLMMGYTHTPDEIYKNALFSVLTSKSEGFALSVLESMYNKTSVISYKIKYGPTDMIVNNENGYLVENEDISSLADRMIEMFKNPDTAKIMGDNARNYIDENFNKNVYKDKWLNVVEAALNNKFSN